MTRGTPTSVCRCGPPIPRFSHGQGRMADDGARYFGPFGGRHEYPGHPGRPAGCPEAALAAAGSSPGTSGKERPCLNFHMGQCDGYCRKEMARRPATGEAIDQAVPPAGGEVQARWGRSCRAEMEAGRGGPAASRRPPRCGTGCRAIDAPGQAAEGGGGLPGGHRRGGPVTRGRPPGAACVGAPLCRRASWPAEDWGLIETPMRGDGGGDSLRSWSSITVARGHPAPADPSALRAGGRGAPGCACSPSRRGAGWSW